MGCQESACCLRIVRFRRARTGFRQPTRVDGVSGTHLAAKHRQPIAQHDQLDLLVELAAAAPQEQPQDRSERELREPKKHPSSLSRAAGRASARTEPGLDTLQGRRRVGRTLRDVVTASSQRRRQPFTHHIGWSAYCRLHELVCVDCYIGRNLVPRFLHGWCVSGATHRLRHAAVHRDVRRMSRRREERLRSDRCRGGVAWALVVGRHLPG